MKVFNYLLFLFVFAGCTSNKKPAEASRMADTIKNTEVIKKRHVPKQFKPFMLNKDYLVIDTGQYTTEGPMTGGSYAIIKRNGAIADTIDLWFGVKDLGNDTYLYQPLRGEIDPAAGGLLLNPAEYVLVKNNKKLLLSATLPNFDEWFSSPNAINSKIYYWQLENIDSAGTEKVSAAQYDPLTKLTKSRYLTNELLETDNTNYFSPPYLEKDSVVYEIEDNKKWKFSISFNAN